MLGASAAVHFQELQTCIRTAIDRGIGGSPAQPSAAARRRCTGRRSDPRRVVPEARRRLPRGSRGAEPRRTPGAHRRHGRRPDPVARHADDLRGRRNEAGSQAGARPRRVRGRDHEHDDQLLGRHHGLATRHREAVLCNQAHLDPRVRTVPGTPLEPEALICVPLIARGAIKGALNIYREGDAVAFSETEFEIAKRFGDAAALALDNAEIRERLEHQARTDSLTGLFNHSVFYERLLQSLQESSRTHRPLAVLMLDIDDFKHVNDVHGHAVGDELLRFLAEALRAIVRPDDVICRLGGEEFAVVMDGCGGEDAVRVADRVQSRLAEVDFPGIGRMTVSVGLSLGPEHAMNPRELAACAEAAMMTAKAQGKNQVVLYNEAGARRPDAPGIERDVRSIAHLKMLQSLTGRLNRLNDVREIGDAIAAELRSLVDYHNCRVFVVDGDELIPVAFLGDLTSGTDSLSLDILQKRVGEGVTGRCAELGESIVVADAANCEFGQLIEGTVPIEESLLAVPLRYGTRVAGVIVVSKLGLNQFDEDDVRLLEVLAGHAAVAVENASLYESARREAESATSLLEFGRELATLVELDDIAGRVTEL